MVSNTNQRDHNPNDGSQSTLHQIVPASNRSRLQGDMLSPVPSQRRRIRRHISRRRRIQLEQHPDNRRNRVQNIIESSRPDEAETTTGTNSDDDDYEKPTLIKLIKQLVFNYTILAVTASFTGYLIHWMETSFERRVLAKNQMIRFEAFQDVITNYNHKLIFNELNSGNDGTNTTTTSIMKKEKIALSFETNTSQYHALSWLVNHDPRHLSPWNTSLEDEIIVRYTLATLYYSISSSDLLPSPPFENLEKNYTVKRGRSNGGYDATLDYRFYFINVTQTTNVYTYEDMLDGNEDGIDVEFGDHHINSNRPWLSKYPVCYWQGIHCNYMDQVTRIQLGTTNDKDICVVFHVNSVSILFHNVTFSYLIEDLSVVGTAPTELGFLGNLEVLDFCTSIFSFCIPLVILGYDSDIVNLFCSSSFAIIIFSFLFPAAFNLMSGTIPSELGRDTSIKHLNFGSYIRCW